MDAIERPVFPNIEPGHVSSFILVISMEGGFSLSAIDTVDVDTPQ